MFWADRVEAGNRDYQGNLAASLVGTMGVDRAVHTCLALGWDGVLEKVLWHRTVDVERRGAIDRPSRRP